MPALYALLILLFGLAIDAALGEPPLAVHPVAWLGKFISLLVKGGFARRPAGQLLYGGLIVLLSLAVFVTPVYFLLFYLKSLSPVIYVLAGALIFKITFSLKELRHAALLVRNLIVADKLAQARSELRALVGRDTANLDKSRMVSAAVESVAENLCDSFVAPLFYFMFFGVPGAVAYRVINTLDAMIGHHGEFEYLGKPAAKLDTIANFIPARISAALIVLASWFCQKDARGAWRIMRRDRVKTESPNAGWTMSAIAGALGVRLEKAGYYQLGDTRNSLSAGTIDASQKIIVTAALIWSLLVSLAPVIYYAAT